MKQFWVRVVSLCVILMILGRYNYIIEAREYKQSVVDAMIAAAEEAARGAGYTDGTYTGAGTGYGGTIEVEVIVEGGNIADITITSAALEDALYLSMAEGVIDEIIEAQDVDVDTISGATFSSKGIIEAVTNALSEARDDTESGDSAGDASDDADEEAEDGTT